MQNKNNVEKQRRFDRATVILELENDRRTVETSFFFNVNFYSEIRFKKLIDSKTKIYNKIKG